MDIFKIQCTQEDYDINILWSDFDQDSYHDLLDDLPRESTQFSDIDGDGYGDSLTGIQFDVCPFNLGTQPLMYLDVEIVMEMDGQIHQILFPLNDLSWSDSDGDNFPDQGRDVEIDDDCPLQSGESTRNDTLGCQTLITMDGQIWMMILIMMQVNGLIVT